MIRALLLLPALAAFGCASATPPSRWLREGEICGSDRWMSDPRAPTCGPRLVCVSSDGFYGRRLDARNPRRCEAFPFFGPR